MAIISRLAVLLGLDAGEFNAGLGKAKDKVEAFGIGAKLSLATVGFAFVSATKSAIEYADKIADVAKANDISVSSVLRLSQALQVNGGQSENSARLMASFNMKIDEAAQGSDKAQKAFTRIGISIKDLKTLSPEQLFEKVVKSLGSMQETTSRNALAMELFGKAIKGVDIKGLADSMDENKGSFKDTEDAFMRINSSMDKFAVAGQTLKVNMAQNSAGLIEAVANWAEKYITHGKEMKEMNDQLLKQYGQIDFFLWKIGAKELELKKPEFGSVQGAGNVSGALTGIGGISDKNAIVRQVALAESIQKANDALNQQIKNYELETASIGKVKSAENLLNIEFEKGGKYVQATQAEKIKANEKAIALDKARQAFELKSLMDTSKFEENKLIYQQAYNDSSAQELQYQMDILDLDKKINDEKEKGFLLLKEEEDAYRQQEMDRITRKKNIADEQHTFEYGWHQAYKNYVRDATDAAKNAGELFDTMAKGMEDALATFIKTGKLDFKSFANLIIDEIARIEARLMASKILDMMGAGSSGGLFGGIMSLLGGGNTTGAYTHSVFNAGGGDLGGGQASVVGENGPELFIPRTAGTILPNTRLNDMMGNQAQIVYNAPVIQNMSAIDTQSGLQFLAKNKQGVWAANQSAQRSLPQSR